MGCGASTSSATAPAARPGSHDSDKARKQSVFEANIPIIPLTKGSAVQFQPPPNTRIIFIFGGPGSGKGRLVANLRSMFGIRLISAESIILKYLPKKVQHAMTLTTTEEMAELVKKEPSHVTLEWVLRLIQHVVESDPDQIFIIDLVPSLKWLMRDEHLIKECTAELEAFEQKDPISFAIHLSLTEDSLKQTLDYSHHNTNLPPGATVADEADNTRAKRRYLMHQQAVKPFLEYFHSSDRVVTVDVSSGAMEPIWDKVHEFFTSLHLQAWRPVNSVLVFAMEGLQVGNLNLANCDMNVIILHDITTDPNAPIESLLEVLSKHIDTLADSSHYFVIDPSGTTIMNTRMNEFNKRSIVFSDVREESQGCVNKFSRRLNALVGGDVPYFKAVCSSEDETLLFPASTVDEFCQQMALCMAEKHPSKR